MRVCLDMRNHEIGAQYMLWELLPGKTWDLFTSIDVICYI